ncbi:MAG: hypothetical protein QWI73_00735 [Alphaproteobacteria bacterium]|nr:hypothetical protein [Alphaproteobacteria bacterium]
MLDKLSNSATIETCYAIVATTILGVLSYYLAKRCRIKKWQLRFAKTK